jgi:hypothetical protein
MRKLNDVVDDERGRNLCGRGPFDRPTDRRGGDVDSGDARAALC